MKPSDLPPAKTIRFRLAFLFLATVFVCISATGIYSSSLFQKQYIQKLQDRLFDLSHSVEALLEATPEGQRQERIAALAGRMGGAAKVRFTVVADDGVVLADSESDPARMDNHRNRPEIRAAASAGEGVSRRMSATVKREFLYAARRTTVAGRPLYIRVAAPSARIEESLHYIRTTVFFATGASILLSAVMAFFITAQFSKPIEDLRETSRRIAAGDLFARTSVARDDELGQLAKAIDEMAENIQSSIKNAERQKNQIENILKSMQDGVAVIDRKRNVILINDSTLDVFELKKGAYAGSPFASVIRNSAVNEAVSRALEEETFVEVEIELHPLRKTHINVRAFPYRRSNGKMGGAIVVFRDVSRMKRLEQTRAEFIDNASHELRTPVSLIRGFVETLTAGAMEEKEARERFLALLDKESLRLKNLTEDILALNRAERTPASAEGAIIDAVEELRHCAASFEMQIQEKGLVFETEFPQEKALCRISAGDFSRVIANLIDNAVKFTDEGKICVRCRVGAGRLVVEVEDTGLGVPQPEIARIFERFYRVEKSRSREMGGTGLGLSIVKHLVEKRSGQIAVQSRPGHGSKFTVELPLEGAEPPVAKT